MDDIDEIKTLVEGFSNGVEQFKSRHRADVDALQKRLDAIEAKANRAALGGGFGGIGDGELKGDPAERKAVAAFVRNGAADWTQEAEIKGMSVGSEPDGGFLVLPVLSATMTARLRSLSPMRRLSRVETLTQGDTFEELLDRDEADAVWVGEKTARPGTDTPQLGKFRIPLCEIYANPIATQRILDDADRDLGAWLVTKIADKFARSEGSAFVNGDGILKPKGFIRHPISTAADGARELGTLQYVPSGAASNFPSSNPADVLKTLMWTLRTPYRTGAVWLMNSATASTVDKFKDGQGSYIWRDAITAGTPPTLLGYPVEIDEGMPDIAADALPIAFGNFQLGYCVVDRPGIKLLRDPYTNKPNVNFYAYKRVGGGVANDDAIKVLKIATS